MKSFVELVKSRRSVRTFDGNMPDAKVIEELKAFAQTISNPYGVDVRFIFLDAAEHKLSSPVLSGEKLYVSAVVKKQEHAEEAYGYSFEKLLMKAHELGLGTVMIGGTMPREKFEAASNLEEGEVMPCVSPLGVAAKKMGVKEVLMRKGVKADTRFDFSELFFKGNFNTPLTQDEAKECGILLALEAVRLAPSAVNKQPWRVVVTENGAHFYEKKDRGYDNGTYDLQKVDLGIAMYHFENQCREEGKQLTFKIADPEIALPEKTEYIASYLF